MLFPYHCGYNAVIVGFKLPPGYVPSQTAEKDSQCRQYNEGDGYRKHGNLTFPLYGEYDSAAAARRRRRWLLLRSRHVSLISGYCEPADIQNTTYSVGEQGPLLK